MPKRGSSPDAARRNFLKGAGLIGAAAAVAPPAANALPVAPPTQLKAAVPGPRQIAAETMPPGSDPVNQTTSGGDFMIDVVNSLGIEYLAINCASSFRGLHEAILNHGNNKPEIITCVHEDIAVHMGQGYAKIEGKPIAMACHGTVGLQHATMAMYNAWCDRVPVIVIGGNIMEADKRMPGADWVHSGVDIGALVRDFTKWDDQPASLQHFAESAVRAYKIATTPPMGPVFLSLDAELQENPIPDGESLHIPKLAPVVPPQGDAGAIAEAAKMLVEAQNPVIICDRLARTPAGMANLVELAETLQCAVIDNAGRMNFPSRHPLNQSFRRGIISQADVILAIEMNDLWGAVNRFQRPHRSPVASDHQAGRQDRHARCPRSLSEIQLSGFRPLPGYRSRHRRRRRSLAAGAHRSGQAPDRCRPQVGLRSARQKTRCAASRHGRAVEERRHDRLGREPDHDRAHVRRGLCPDQGRGLVVGRHLNPADMAAPAVGLQEAASVERFFRRRRRWLHSAGLAWRGAR